MVSNQSQEVKCICLIDQKSYLYLHGFTQGYVFKIKWLLTILIHLKIDLILYNYSWETHPLRWLHVLLPPNNKKNIKNAKYFVAIC